MLKVKIKGITLLKKKLYHSPISKKYKASFLDIKSIPITTYN